MQHHQPPASLPRGTFPALVTLLLLAIPLVAMQFTDQVQWGVGDFLVMGALLLATGLAFEWVLRRPYPGVMRIAAGAGLFSTLLMIWANFAVGLVGGEDSAANGALLVVPLVGIAGSLLCGLRPRGMALTLALMAATQAGITTLALAFEWKPLRHGTVDIWGPNALFILLYLASALLFWGAADRTRSPAVRALRATLLLSGGAVGAAAVAWMLWRRNTG